MTIFARSFHLNELILIRSVWFFRTKSLTSDLLVNPSDDDILLPIIFSQIYPERLLYYPLPISNQADLPKQCHRSSNEVEFFFNQNLDRLNQKKDRDQ